MKTKNEYTYTSPQLVAILRQIRLKVKYEHEKVALDIAINAIRDRDNAIDKRAETCDNIGNLYKTHFTDKKDYGQFEQGYNAAVRDALDILRKK